MTHDSISFDSKGINYLPEKVEDLRTWIFKTVVSEGYEAGDLSFLFCDDAFLLTVNKEYLHHDTYTDIITFDYSEKPVLSGDILISIERIRDNSVTFGTTFNDELHRVIIHGVLHLCGYTDKLPAQKSEMTEKEDYYLSLRTF